MDIQEPRFFHASEGGKGKSLGKMPPLRVKGVKMGENKESSLVHEGQDTKPAPLLIRRQWARQSRGP